MAVKTGKVFRYQELKEALLEEILPKDPGAKLGSIKQIMDHYNVSQATVDKAVQSLKEEGFVESRIGMGLFVAERSLEQAPQDLSRVDLLFFGTDVMFRNEGFHKDLITELGRFLGDDGGWLRLSTISRTASRKEMVDKIDELSPKAVLTMYVTDREIPEILSRRQIPCLHLMPYWPSDCPNSFYVDNRQSIRMSLDCLINAGHKDIAFFHGKEGDLYNRDMAERLQFFYEEMARSRIIADPDLVVESGFEKQHAYEATNRLLSRNKKFTAVIINDHQAGGVYQALLDHGLVIGKDVSVVGTDDLSWAAQMHPALTTIRISRMQLARLAVTELEKMIEGKSEGFSRIDIPSKLIERESVGKPV